MSRSSSGSKPHLPSSRSSKSPRNPSSPIPPPLQKPSAENSTEPSTSSSGTSPSPKWATLEGEEHDLATRTIAGNASDELKLFLAHLFRLFRSQSGKKGFVDAVGERVRIVAVDVDRDTEGEACLPIEKGKENASRKRKRARVGAKVVCECVVERDMTNAGDNLHGGCTGYLIDICSSLPIAASTQVIHGTGYSGVTQAINVVYHAPAPIGTELEIISTTLAIGGRTMSARCEIWDKKKKRLVASGVHMKMDSSVLLKPGNSTKAEAKL